MTDEARDDDEVTTDEPQDEAQAAPEAADDAAPLEGADEAPEAAQADEGEVVIVTAGDDEPAGEETAEQRKSLVQRLRDENREKAKRLRELEQKVAEVAASSQAKPLGPRPSLWDDGIAGDEEKLAEAITDWTAAKLRADQEAERRRAESEAQAKEWQGNVQQYAAQKAKITDPQMAEAEEEVTLRLSEVQQAIILDVCANKAHVVCALGKNHEELQRLAAIKSPAKFAAAIARFEDRVKEFRKTPNVPAPERKLTSSAKVPASTNANLEAMRDKARKTGDYTAYFAAKNKAA